MKIRFILSMLFVSYSVTAFSQYEFVPALKEI